MTKFLNISTDNTLGGSSPSDETVSSQKAIKAYVDSNYVKSVNNISPVNGNVTLNIPSVEAYTSAEVDTIWNSVTAN